VCTGGIFLFCLILLRSLRASFFILLNIFMILADLMGVMAWWNISLNAVSVVNFVMAIGTVLVLIQRGYDRSVHVILYGPESRLGISVEFCIHMTVAFMRVHGTNDQRVAAAVTGVGASVISGTHHCLAPRFHHVGEVKCAQRER